MIKLKPCPFCGGKAKLKCYSEQKQYANSIETYKEHTGTAVVCSVCGSRGRKDRHNDKAAIEAWNKRAEATNE